MLTVNTLQYNSNLSKILPGKYFAYIPVPHTLQYHLLKSLFTEYYLYM